MSEARLSTARDAFGAAHDELLAAAEEALAQSTLRRFPTAAWLVVDPGRWLEEFGDSSVDIRAVLDATSAPLHEWEAGADEDDRSPFGEWALRAEELLVEIADLDHTNGWKEACDPIARNCHLRTIPVVPAAYLTAALYPHNPDHAPTG